MYIDEDGGGGGGRAEVWPTIVTREKKAYHFSIGIMYLHVLIPLQRNSRPITNMLTTQKV